MSAQLDDADKDKAQQVLGAFHSVFDQRLDEMIRAGGALMRTMSVRQPSLAHAVLLSLTQRAFVMLYDLRDGALNRMGVGYFSAAVLTRAILENAATITVLNRDKSGSMLPRLLNQAATDAARRRDGLKFLSNSSNVEIATAATSEAKHAESIVKTIEGIQNAVNLTRAHGNFPPLKERCKLLGEDWLFAYEAIYRDLF
jgi:hypothetical protein